MNNASLPQPDLGSMVARLAQQVDTLTQEITVLRSLQLQSTGSTDPTLIRQNDSSAFQPSQQLLEAGTYCRGDDGVSKCTFLESLFLSPLSADEKKAVAASSQSMLGVDYSPPQVPEGVSRATISCGTHNSAMSSTKRARPSNGSIITCMPKHRILTMVPIRPSFLFWSLFAGLHQFHLVHLPDETQTTSSSSPAFRARLLRSALPQPLSPSAH